MKGRAN